MKNIKRLILFVMVIITFACSSILIPQVVTNSTAFYKESYRPEGVITVVAAEDVLNRSLEFASYKRKIEDKLAENGYIIKQNANKADYVALVAYGIDNGKTINVSAPIFGIIDHDTLYSSGTAGNVIYHGLNYSMPTYGAASTILSSATTYNRVIALDIVKANSFKTGLVEKVYEGRSRSKGNCAVMVEVFDEMLEAMFKDFPGENGRNRKLEIPAVINC